MKLLNKTLKFRKDRNKSDDNADEDGIIGKVIAESLSKVLSDHIKGLKKDNDADDKAADDKAAAPKAAAPKAADDKAADDKAADDKANDKSEVNKQISELTNIVGNLAKTVNSMVKEKEDEKKAKEEKETIDTLAKKVVEEVKKQIGKDDKKKTSKAILEEELTSESIEEFVKSGAIEQEIENPDELTNVTNARGEKLTKKQVHDRSKLGSFIGKSLREVMNKRGVHNVVENDEDDE